MPLHGSIVPLITPFQNGKIDYKSVEKLVEFHIAQGSHGILPCGSTGESATMTHEEHLELINFVVEITAGRLPIMAGTGSNSTSEAVHLAHGAKSAGVAAHLSITPYYNKPTQEGLYRHFMEIADNVDLPMMLYNVPGRTGVNLAPETVARLATHPNIFGIKEASGNMTQATHILELCGPDFQIFSGDDFINYPLLTLGAAGLISVTANIAPKAIASMCDDMDAGDIKKALATHLSLMPLNRAMFIETNPIPVKAAAHMMGLIDKLEYRAPLCEMSETNLMKLKETLKAFQLIK